MIKVDAPLVTVDLSAFDNPEYVYEAANQRYRNKATGRFVSNKQIKVLIAKRVDILIASLQSLGNSLLDGRLSLQNWQLQTTQALKTIHAQSFLLGAGGQGVIAFDDYLVLARKLKEQYGYFRDFAQACKEGIFPLQFRNRLSLYAKAAKGTYYLGYRQSAKRSGQTHGLRKLGDAEHCKECIDYASMGLTPIDETVLPTEKCSCQVNCQCEVLFTTLAEALNYSDFYEGQARDKNGRFAKTADNSTKIQISSLSELTDSKREKLLKGFDDDAKKNTIIYDGKTYYDLSKISEDEANKRLTSFIDKIATIQATRDRNAIEIKLASEQKRKVDLAIKKQQEKAYKILHPYSTLTLEQFEQWNPEEFQTLLQRHKNKKREDAKKKREEMQRENKRQEQIELAKTAFENAPDDFKLALEQYGVPDVIRPMDEYQAFYSPVSSKVHMDEHPKSTFKNAYRHEYGHYLDNQIAKRMGVAESRYISSSKEGQKAFKEDTKELKQSSYKKAAAQALESGNEMDALMIHDIAAALSKNKLGYGHDSAYFSIKGNSEVEVFANIISFMGSGNPKLTEAAEMIAPNVFKFIKNVL